MLQVLVIGRLYTEVKLNQQMRYSCEGSVRMWFFSYIDLSSLILL